MYQDATNQTSIRNVVNKVRNRANLPEQDDVKVFQAVMDTMRDLSLFTLPSKQSVKITIDSLGRVQLPADYLAFIGVGVPKYGVMYYFSRNNSIVTTSTRTYESESFDTDYGENESIPISATYHYGAGGGQYDTSFVLDERRRQIQLIDFTGTECTLDYISSGISDTPENVYIPKIAEDALIAGSIWRVSVYDKSISLGERREYERLYGDAERDLRALYGATIQELVDAIYKDTYQTVKR